MVLISRAGRWYFSLGVHFGLVNETYRQQGPLLAYRSTKLTQRKKEETEAQSTSVRAPLLRAPWKRQELTGAHGSGRFRPPFPNPRVWAERGG